MCKIIDYETIISFLISYYISVIVLSYTLYAVGNSPFDNVTDNGGDFIYQDDNIKVDYRFNNKDGVFEFSVYNISNEDIFIDLEKSVFVYNSKVYDYAGREDRVSAYTESSLTYGSTSVLSTRAVVLLLLHLQNYPLLLLFLRVLIEPLLALILTKIFIASCFSLVIQNLKSMFVLVMTR